MGVAMNKDGNENQNNSAINMLNVKFIDMKHNDTWDRNLAFNENKLLSTEMHFLRRFAKHSK